jgi:hypothetical protein
MVFAPGMGSRTPPRVCKPRVFSAGWWQLSSFSPSASVDAGNAPIANGAQRSRTRTMGGFELRGPRSEQFQLGPAFLRFFAETDAQAQKADA